MAKKNKRMESIEEHDPVHGDSRTMPIHRVTNIFARAGAVVIEGFRGTDPAMEEITIQEAIYRAKAISDMTKSYYKHRSDRKEQLDLLEKMVNAIKKAKEQRDGFGFKSTRVSMAGAYQEPESPIRNSEGSVIVDGVGHSVQSKPKLIIPD